MAYYSAIATFATSRATQSRSFRGWGERHLVRLGHGFNHELPIAHIDSTTQGRLARARFFQAMVGEQFDVTLGHVSERLRGGARVGGWHVGDAIMDDAFLHEHGIVVSG